MDFPHDQVPPGVIAVCTRLREAGHRAWIVGGCVRDLLLGRDVGDWDVATSARPDEVKRVFRKVIPTGIDHGTVTVLHRGGSYEVTTLRGEGTYSDGRHPDEVTFVDDIAEDLARRDFTVNAIAYEPTTQAVVDPHGGLDDLEARRLRAVGNPEERFAEDGLRILRGARFVATLDFELEARTEAAFEGVLDVYEKVSPERVREEWLKAMKAPRPSRAFRVMRRTGILGRTCPALGELDDASFDLSLDALDASTATGAERIGALLHRMGCARGATGHAYARTSADLAEGWLRDYRFSNAERRSVVHAIAHHRQLLGLALDDGAAMRRFVSAVGRSELETVARLAFAVADAEGQLAGAEAIVAAARSVAESTVPLAVGDLALGGREVMAELGGGGRVVGKVLDLLLARTLADPSTNDAETLRRAIPAIVEALEQSDGEGARS